MSGRVEVVTPVLESALRHRLWKILDISLGDRRQAWIMTPSGEYRRLEPEPGGAAVDGTQATLHRGPGFSRPERSPRSPDRPVAPRAPADR